jgi:hypothetical protein
MDMYKDKQCMYVNRASPSDTIRSLLLPVTLATLLLLSLLLSLPLGMSVYATEEGKQRIRFSSDTIPWGGVISVSEGSNDSTSPSMLVGSDGTLYIVWQEYKSRNDAEILLSMSTDGGLTFMEPLNVSNSAYMDENPRIALTDDGTLYIVWQSRVDNNYEIMLATFKDGKVTKPINISRNSGSSINASMVVSNGSVYIVWQDNTPGNYDIMLRISNDHGKSFSEVMNISNDTGNSMDPSLAIDGSNVYILWRTEETDMKEKRSNIMLRISNDHGKSFSEVMNISRSKGHATNASMVVSNGSVYIVWQDNTPGNYDIMLRISNNSGSSFSNTVNLSSNSGNSIEPSIVVHDSSIYIAWRDDTFGRHDIMLRISNDHGKSFSEVMNISRSSNISMLPRLALDEKIGRLYIVWNDIVTTSGGEQKSIIAMRYYDIDDNVISGMMNISTSEDAEMVKDTNVIVTANDERIYVTWQRIGSFNSSIMLRSSSWISIDYVSNSMLRWGIDELLISGKVNSDSKDRVVVDWGDGTGISSDTAVISESNTWSARHVYGASSVGSRDISVTLVDKDGKKKASASIQVNVLKHRTSIDGPVLEDTTVRAGGKVAVIYTRLIDVETGEGIVGKVITYDGTALMSSKSMITGSDGSVRSMTLDITDDSISSGSIYAVFKGDGMYESSTSTTVRISIDHTYNDGKEMYPRIVEFLVEDINGDSMYVTVDGDDSNALSTLVRILRDNDREGTDTTKVYIGGRLEYSRNNEYGFIFNPDTVRVVVGNDDYVRSIINGSDIASGFKDIHDRFAYWKDKDIVYLQGNVNTLKESVGIKYQGSIYYVTMVSDGARLLEVYIEPDLGKMLLFIDNQDKDREVRLLIPDGLIVWNDDGNNTIRHSNDLTVVMNGKSIDINTTDGNAIYPYKEIRLFLPKDQSTIRLEIIDIHIIPEFPNYITALLILALGIYIIILRTGVINPQSNATGHSCR